MAGLYELIPSPGQTITTAAGVFAGNTAYGIGYVTGLRVKPATASTAYDLTVKDREGYTIYSKAGLKGEYTEDTGRIPFFGVMTVSIANATANETFTCKIMVQP